MNNLTATLCLALAILLGSVGVSNSNDFLTGHAAYKKGDFKTALQVWNGILRKNPVDAEERNSAMFYLGVMHHKGRGVPQNQMRALIYFFRGHHEHRDQDAKRNWDVLSKGMKFGTLEEVDCLVANSDFIYPDPEFEKIIAQYDALTMQELKQNIRNKKVELCS